MIDIQKAYIEREKTHLEDIMAVEPERTIIKITGPCRFHVSWCSGGKKGFDGKLGFSIGDILVNINEKSPEDKAELHHKFMGLGGAIEAIEEREGSVTVCGVKISKMPDIVRAAYVEVGSASLYVNEALMREHLAKYEPEKLK